MEIREPAVAGVFYPTDESRCRRQLQDMIPSEVVTENLPATLRGGIAPHAGWAFSGKVCGLVMATLAARARPETVVMFGAAHRRVGAKAAVFGEGAWRTPLGLALVDAELASRVVGDGSLVQQAPQAHQAEHSIEVQVPFVQQAFAGAKILPILVEPSAKAVEIGERVAEAARAALRPVVFLGSTDLTHYGPHYHFAPEGVGEEGLAWAKQVNDRRLIEVIRRMWAEQVVSEAAEHSNACGAGAIAATMAACRAMGASQAMLLAHVSSAEVAREMFGQASLDSVGYAGIVLG